MTVPLILFHVNCRDTQPLSNANSPDQIARDNGRLHSPKRNPPNTATYRLTHNVDLLRDSVPRLVAPVASPRPGVRILEEVEQPVGRREPIPVPWRNAWRRGLRPKPLEHRGGVAQQAYIYSSFQSIVHYKFFPRVASVSTCSFSILYCSSCTVTAKTINI